MTNQWFRSWHGAPTDPKWLGIARKGGVAPGIVAALVWALLDRASQANERGSIAGYDADGLGCFFGCEPEQVEAVIAALHDKGVLQDNVFSGWGKHQPKREDGAAERAKEWRERKRTQANASEPEQTLDTDTDTDLEKKVSTRRSPKVETPGFDEFWDVYPNRDGSADRKGAVKAFNAAVKRASFTTILEGAEHFTAAMKARGKVGTEFIPQARTWLNGDRWNDRYDAAPTGNSKEAEWLATIQKHASAVGSQRDG